jgi:hypothetical protein
MSFKWGLAVMNAPKPNSSAALDLLATMEAFDKYNNLRDAIFEHHVEESAVIFNTERDPVLIKIRAKSGIPLLVKVSECGLVDDPLLHAPVLRERGSCPEFESWIRSGKKARLCYEDGGDVWGIDIMDNILVESVIPFLEKIEKKGIQKTLIYKDYSLHVLLGDDNNFLHTVCGLQSCSATNFCIHCEASLERLRKERDMSSGILRTRNTAITQLARVNEGTSKVKREELAKVNVSYINPLLVGIAYDRICFATLYVIIGIQNSLLEHLTVRLRHHKTACLSELSLLTEGRDNLLHHIAGVKNGEIFTTKITSQQSNSGRNIIRFILLQQTTRKSATKTVLSWRRSTRAPLYARMRQRKSKRHKTQKSCRHIRSLPKLFIFL